MEVTVFQPMSQSGMLGLFTYDRCSSIDYACYQLWHFTKQVKTLTA